jgi:hypothetical protein
MGLFQIIESKSQWNSLLREFKDVDLYYSYEYGNLFAKNENGKLMAAYYADDYTKVFYPFIRRNVVWDEEGGYDIVTPYGYGGPLIEGIGEKIKPFFDCLTEYCIKNNIITETIRFHPIIRNYEKCNKFMEVDYIRKTTAVDLSPPLEEIRKQYSSMNKRNIKKAKNEGIHCFLVENTLKNINTFFELYLETMKRNNADSYYYFNENYFYEQIKESKISKTYLLFAQYKGEIIAGVMVLKGPKYSHYHLGASKTKFLHLRPNNYLFDFMIEFCKSKGSTLLHLGGGYQENDGLFKFKESFSNGNNFDYYIGKKVYDEKKYNRIIEGVRRYYKVNENYFPVYRGKREVITNTVR